MTFLEAVSIPKANFIQVCRGLSDEKLNILREEFELQLSEAMLYWYDQQYGHECNLFRGVLLNKLLSMYELCKISES
jgi:hypothetical protein